MNTVYLNIYLKSYRHGNTPQQCPISHIFPIWYNAKKHLYSKVSIPEELSYCRLSGGGALRHNPARNWLFLSWTRVSIFFFNCFMQVGGEKGASFREGGRGLRNTQGLVLAHSLTMRNQGFSSGRRGWVGVCGWGGVTRNRPIVTGSEMKSRHEVGGAPVREKPTPELLEPVRWRILLVSSRQVGNLRPPHAPHTPPPPPPPPWNTWRGI